MSPFGDAHDMRAERRYPGRMVTTWVADCLAGGSPKYFGSLFGATPATAATVAGFGRRTFSLAHLEAQRTSPTIARPLERITCLFGRLSQATLQRSARQGTKVDLAGITWLKHAQRVGVL